MTRNQAGSVVWTYSHNTINGLEDERLTVDGKTFLLDHMYNGMGYLDKTTYPSGHTVSFAPNAFGEARSVSGHVSNAQYHANGAPSSYTYANGFGFRSAQTASGLPSTFFKTLDI
ncbi:hypothetical protein ISG33_12595 [Glaciecola sp. MH2013]|uniref:hypothetical protein n=1 Tax=Glaciecola sp. MH2013 TaxID=2785524 RepID=UPI00189F3177|nr:hypothetical protein [Glaciecola sp. MH2013]MBF7074238.1 hypothetical protein [Glaciecola sp. MH2013]